MAAVIAGWSVTETHLGRTFAALIGAKQPAAMGMCAAVRSFEARRDLLQAAANEILPRRYAMMIAAALVVIGRADGDRNKFAHWVWGASADPELDALFLVEPRHFLDLAAQQFRYWTSKAAREMSPLTAHMESPRIDHSRIYGYRLNDLEDAKSRIERAFRMAEALRRLVENIPAIRRQIYNWLCNEADLQKALKDVKKRHPKRSRRALPSLQVESAPS